MKGYMIMPLIMIMFQLNAQELNGDWQGKLSYQGVELTVIFHIEGESGNYMTTMDSPDQGATGITAQKTVFDNGTLTISSTDLNMTFSGQLDETNKIISGTFNQQGVSVPLKLTKQGEKKLIEAGQNAYGNIVGDWSGKLSISGMELLMVFHISISDKHLVSTMDSPDQNTFDIAMDTTVFQGGILTISAGSLNMQFEAELNTAGDTLFGSLNQSGMSLEMVMTKEVIEREEIVRPQEPKDFPYIQDEVRFENPVGGHTLAGTLTIPEDGKFDKVVVLITGSGPQDRNEEVVDHKPFLVLSDHFTRRGIAVLRYDDRGVGESEGVFSEATSKDFADDAAAAVAYLMNRKEMIDKAIGLVGHSEGGMIAPMVATNNPNVDFVVLLAGPGIEIKELLLWQQERIGSAEGFPDAARSDMAILSRKTFDFLEENYHKSADILREELTEFLNDHYEKLKDETKQILGDKENFVTQQLRIFVSPWYLYFMRFSPDDFLSKLQCPILAVNGELDLQVTSEENLEGLRKSLNRANNKEVTIHEFKGLNHLFQKAKTGAPSEYARLEETFNEAAMQYISDWILELKIGER